MPVNLLKMRGAGKIARLLRRVNARGSALRLTAAALLMISLNACAIPPVVAVAKLAADGVLLVATGKSSTDHGISVAVGQDCATLRMLESEYVCRDVILAEAEPLPAEVIAGRVRFGVPSETVGTDASAGAEPVILAAASPKAEDSQMVQASGLILDQVFAMKASDGGASVDVGGRGMAQPVAVVVASLPRPIDRTPEDAVTRVAQSVPATKTLASAEIEPAAMHASRAVRAHPGLIKALPPPPPSSVVKASLRSSAGIKPVASKAEDSGKAQAPAADEAPEGTVGKLLRMMNWTWGDDD